MKSNEFPYFSELVETISALRDPKSGCPWDLKQDHKSLCTYLVEECYELIHAIETGDSSKIEEELGDVLLQVLLHAQIGKEKEYFNIESISQKINQKMIRRHPHVFGSKKEKSLNSNEVKLEWDKIKRKERSGESFFREEEAYLPSLLAAFKIGRKSAKANFDWETSEQVFKKVTEEYFELKEEFDKKQKKLERVKEEAGDLLFSIVQFLRHLDTDAEDVLRQSNLKFIKRFNKLERLAKKRDLNLFDLNVAELEELWGEIKK